ncbi:MAG: hypothetical protein MJ175_07625 [Clostridia bacterium]|nr:hypothetical protein [Clostridia bacterium]
MSVCTLIAADCPLAKVAPEKDYPVDINLDTGEIHDGGEDDNFYLTPYPDISFCSDKAYGVTLEWNYTPGRAKRVISYIRDIVERAGSAELIRAWLDYFYDNFDERPIYKRQEIRVVDLTEEMLKALDEADPWSGRDRMRPVFTCLRITQ